MGLSLVSGSQLEVGGWVGGWRLGVGSSRFAVHGFPPGRHNEPASAISVLRALGARSWTSVLFPFNPSRTLPFPPGRHNESASAISVLRALGARSWTSVLFPFNPSRTVPFPPG